MVQNLNINLDHDLKAVQVRGKAHPAVGAELSASFGWQWNFIAYYRPYQDDLVGGAALAVYPPRDTRAGIHVPRLISRRNSRRR